jgi:GxxExxY protein
MAVNAFTTKGTKFFTKGTKEIVNFVIHFVSFVVKILYLQNQKRTDMTENELAKLVYGAGLKVHQILGAGLLESAYEECLYYELQNCGLNIEKQKILPLVYDNVKLDAGYRIDLLIEKKLIVEIKSVEALNDLHLAQILTYLKLSDCKLGLLINFNTVLFKNGVKRVINGYI